MAQTTIITKPGLGKIDTIVIDATVNEGHSMTNTVTDHPVESGANVSDHIREDPDRLTMECIVSNTPLSDGQTRQVRDEKTGSTFNVTAQQDLTRAKSAYDRLVEIRSGTLITVVTSLKTYSSMAIESITIPREGRKAGALYFSVALKKIRVVQNKLTRTTVSRDPRVGGKVKTGAQTMTFTEEELYGKQSVLDKGVDGIRDSLSNGALKGFVGAVGG